MKNNNAAQIHAMISKLKPHPVTSWLTRGEAAGEIAEALQIPYAAAMMTLYGVCATGGVRWVDNSGESIEEDELTVANFSDKPERVAADDLKACLVEWSHIAQLSTRDEVIKKMLHEGNTPRKLTGKVFCHEVRKACNGEQQRGFGDRTILNVVRGLGKK